MSLHGFRGTPLQLPSRVVLVVGGVSGSGLGLGTRAVTGGSELVGREVIAAAEATSISPRLTFRSSSRLPYSGRAIGGKYKPTVEKRPSKICETPSNQGDTQQPGMYVIVVHTALPQLAMLATAAADSAAAARWGPPKSAQYCGGLIVTAEP